MLRNIVKAKEFREKVEKFVNRVQKSCNIFILYGGEHGAGRWQYNIVPEQRSL
jgi:hypothetical protein